jgi:hypothetical protein
LIVLESMLDVDRSHALRGSASLTLRVLPPVKPPQYVLPALRSV